jgi:hypothetical protein
MKNLEIWSRDIDRRVLVIAHWMFILGLAASVGLLYPTQPLPGLPPINALVSGLLLVLVRGFFHLVRPSRPGQTWLLIERVGIPVVWMLFLAVLLFCVHVACERHSEMIERGKLECALLTQT